MFKIVIFFGGKRKSIMSNTYRWKRSPWQQHSAGSVRSAGDPEAVVPHPWSLASVWQQWQNNRLYWLLFGVWSGMWLLFLRSVFGFETPASVGTGSVGPGEQAVPASALVQCASLWQGWVVGRGGPALSTGRNVKVTTYIVALFYSHQSWFFNIFSAILFMYVQNF